MTFTHGCIGQPCVICFPRAASTACWHTADVTCPNCARARGVIGYAGPTCHHCYCIDQPATTGLKAHIVCCKCNDRRLASQTTVNVGTYGTLTNS